nr:copper resistance protein CopC [Kibdelosporangium sp. MJ126-NF4]CEL17191.1 Copper resistance protein D [Kibdelosporangium sp. MJ126-NF4]CTQ91579.1 Copper resistance protein D [Kibdelosporangium sp. MJ126-NF4]
MRGLLLVVLFTTSTFIGLTPQAFAHAELLGTTPSNGGHSAVAPTEVLLRFSEPVKPVRDGFVLLNGQGKRTGDGQPEADGDSVRLRLAQSLPDGVYSLSWRVVSVDSHPIHGALVFSVGDAQAAPLVGGGAEAGADPVVAAAFWLARWIGFGSIALVIGGAVFVMLCWREGREDRRYRRITGVAWWAAVGSSAAMFLLQGANTAGTPVWSVFSPGLIADTAGSVFGILLLARLVLLVLFRLVWPLVVAVALAVTWSASGHAVAGDWAAAAVLLDVVHVLAMSVWLGGLVVLLTCSLSSRDVVARFSRVAMVSVAVLAVTGVVMALRETGFSLDSDSQYVTLLVFKVGAFGLLLWLAAMSRNAVGGWTSRSARTSAIVRLRRSVWAEAGIAAAVLALTSVLVATPPTGIDSRVAAPVAVSGPFLRALAMQDSGDVQVWLSPAQTGPNQVVVNVRDDKGINRDVPEVTAQLSLPSAAVGPMPVTLVRTGPGQFVAETVTVPMRGTWQLALRVRTSELDVSMVDAQVPVR